MNRRRLALALVTAAGLLGAIIAVALPAFPELARQVAIRRLQAMTGRTVSLERVDLALLAGRASVHGLRVLDRDGASTLAELPRVDIALRYAPLLTGHVWLRELTLRQPTVRVVRTGPAEFNISDMVRRSGAGPGRPLDVTVDRFTLVEGTTILEDRVLQPVRTWTSERVAIEARNLSTRRDDGTATGSSITAGAPVSVTVTALRLYPIHLRAEVDVQGLDVSLVRLYVPASAPVTIERGRASTRVAVRLDAREGLHVDGEARIADAVLVRPGTAEPLVTSPALAVAVADVALGTGALRVGRLQLGGRATVFDRRAAPVRRYDLDPVRAAISDLTWPVRMPARIEIVSAVPGGGRLDVRGDVRARSPCPAPAGEGTDPCPDGRPASARVKIRLTGTELGAWSQFVPVRARVTGTAAADLTVDAELDRRIVARATGTASVSRLAVVDAGRRLASAERIAVSGVAWEYPFRVTLERVEVRRPAAVVERDASGQLTLLAAVATDPPAGTPDRPAEGGDRPTPAPRASPTWDIRVAQVRVRDGSIDWRDAAVAPPASLRVTELQATVAVAQISPLRVAAKGSAAVNRLSVSDRGRPVLTLARGEAQGIDVEWPGRVALERLTLRQPWALVEREADGRLPLVDLVRRAVAADGAPGVTAGNAATEEAGQTTDISVRQVGVVSGRARFVDRTLAAPHVEDVQDLTLRLTGLGTSSAQPARVELAARLAGAATLQLQGRLRPFGALHVDVGGRLRDYPVSQANPYLRRMTAWIAREGRLSADLRLRLADGQVDARNDVQLVRLRMQRAQAGEDEARQRLGLPLGLLTGLMKNTRGEIRLPLAISGRLDDLRLELGEAIWSALRRIAINTIALPVSWIGRVYYTHEALIEDIDVDPVWFEPGATALTREGVAQLGRIANFLRETPDVRMVLTPVVTLGDIDALRRDEVRAAIDRRVRETGMPPVQAGLRLLDERRPGHDSLRDIEAIVAAIAETWDPPEQAAVALARDRAGDTRDALRKAGIDPARLEVRGDAEAVEAPGGGHVDFVLTDRVRPRRHLLAELLRTLRELVRALAVRDG